MMERIFATVPRGVEEQFFPHGEDEARALDVNAVIADARACASRGTFTIPRDCAESPQCGSAFSKLVTPLPPRAFDRPSILVFRAASRS